MFYYLWEVGYKPYILRHSLRIQNYFLNNNDVLMCCILRDIDSPALWSKLHTIIIKRQLEL